MKIFGEHDEGTKTQLATCIAAEDGARGVLCADGHIGYSMPIGGVVGYRDSISPSGVGYDIACGNYAVKTDIKSVTLSLQDRENIADDIVSHIDFGMGGSAKTKTDHGVFDQIRQGGPEQKRMLQLAQNQLGTVGSGNHYVDLLEDGEGYVWVACHFGSRGFGHKTAKGFLNLHRNEAWDAHGKDGEMFSPPVLFDVSSTIGQSYIEAMTIAGAYAYAGREVVVKTVLDILRAHKLDEIHNHHNFAWRETHDGESYWVVRKGATPAQPKQRGFVGGSMGDISVILHGVDSQESRDALYSTVHGAGRVMSRNVAIKGKFQWECPMALDGNQFTWQQSNAPACHEVWPMPQEQHLLPKSLKCPMHGVALRKTQTAKGINFRDVQDDLKSRCIVLRGAGADESPQVYRPLNTVLGAHQNTIRIETILHPIIVVMAGKDVQDHYKD